MRRIHSAGLALAAIAAVACLSTTGGAQAAMPGPDRIASARDAATALGLGGPADLKVRDVIVDADGSSHVRFDRGYAGLPVVGGDFVVHQDRNGRLKSAAGADNRTISLSTKPVLGAPAASAIAGRQAGFAPKTATPKLVVFLTDTATRLAYQVNVEGRTPAGEPAGRYVFVDATSGKVLDSWESVHNDTGSGTGLFSGVVSLDTTATGSGFNMVDPVRGNNATYNAGTLFTDADNVWGDGTTANPQSAGVDAHYGIAKTWDYYKNVHGRNGIGNDGVGARSFVHDGLYVNASWSDSCFCMRYGDGNGSSILPLVELDIAGHEMSHGVTSRTANMRYSGEPGGLNESTSDIFGTAVEFYAANAQDTPDYVVGEEIFADYDPAVNYIRRMDKPSSDGASADCWSRRVGRLDVHNSSGVGNHFFYLLSEGSGAKLINGVPHNSPTCNGSTVAGIGIDKAGKIWYRALTTYWNSRTNYAGARAGTISAATDLYGAGSAEVSAVTAAWNAVNVT